MRSIVRSAGRLLYCDHIEERREELFLLACENDLEDIVAKPRNAPYFFTESDTSWLKIKNPNYSQTLGRDDLFAPARKKPPQADLGRLRDCLC